MSASVRPAMAVGKHLSPLTTGWARQLRQIALHRETAALLDLRASRATSEAEAMRLRRRAAQRRAIAQALRQQAAGRGTSPRWERSSPR
jgi:hypothetical protein